ncbi:MAG: hypothetical protein ACOYZ7_02285 [Chloroflexota bacterium]
MARDDVEIQVIERQTPTDNHCVDYQPFGIKVLKLRIRRNQNNKPALGPIWIHPKGYTRPNAQSDDPALWQAYGTAEGDPSTGSGQEPDLWVAWGAGDERGFCVKTKDRFKINKVPLPLDDDKSYYVYLHLIHRPADPLAHTPTDKTLTVQASGEDGQVYGEISVCLSVPDSAANPVRAHWRWDADAGASILTLKGADGVPAQLPLYVSRWWPACQVSYVPVDETAARFLADLEIVYRRQANGQDSSQVDVVLGDRPLAHFGGDLALPLHDYRLCSAELLRFTDDYHLVLRLWFYWVHLSFSPQQLLTFVTPDQREAWQPEAERVSQGLRKGLAPWHQREEVPDVERFDLLLDPHNLDEIFVGTDTHWQEFWALVAKGQPLKARIATLLDTGKVAAMAKAVPKKQPPVFDPLTNGLCDLVNEFSGHRCPHRAQGRLVTGKAIKKGQTCDVCPRCGSHFTGQQPERAVGLWAKHAPLLENAQLDENLVSTSVLDG